MNAKPDFDNFGKQFLVVGGTRLETKVFRKIDSLLGYLIPLGQYESDNDSRNRNKRISFNEPIWVDIQSPSSSEISKMQKLLAFHPLITQYMQSREVPEKFQFYSSYIYAIFLAPISNSSLVYTSLQTSRPDTALFHMVIFDSIILTVHDYPIKGLNTVLDLIMTKFNNDNNMRRRISSYSCPSVSCENEVNDKIVIGIPSTAWILYAFLDAIVDMYLPKVNNLCSEIDALDQLVYLLTRRKAHILLPKIRLAIRNMSSLKRFLASKYSIACYMTESFQRKKLIANDFHLYTRDVVLHFEHSLAKLEASEKILREMQTNYVTKVLLESAKMRKRTQSFINMMTIFASTWLPSSLIAGIFGMNIKVPGQDHATLVWFVGIVCFIMIMIFFMIILFWNELKSSLLTVYRFSRQRSFWSLLPNFSKNNVLYKELSSNSDSNC
jgi:magnesium transporter